MAGLLTEGVAPVRYRTKGTPGLEAVSLLTRAGAPTAGARSLSMLVVDGSRGSRPRSRSLDEEPSPLRNTMRWTLIIAALAALTWIIRLDLAVTPAVSASTATVVAVEDLIANADLVLEGRVNSIRSVERLDGRIETEYGLTVSRTYWGAAQSERTLRLPGGILASGRGMVVPGVPHFSYAEEVVLALSEPDGDGMRMPIGLDQGCYRLRLENNGDRYAWRTPSAAARIDPATGRLLTGSGAFGVPYGELAAELTAAASARRAGLIGPTEGGR